MNLLKKAVIRGYEFASGKDYRGLNVPDASIGIQPPQVLPTSFDMSAASAGSIAQQDHDEIYNYALDEGRKEVRLLGSQVYIQDTPGLEPDYLPEFDRN